jgi:hypothetical protein
MAAFPSGAHDIAALKRIGGIVSGVLHAMLGAAIRRTAKAYGFRIIEPGQPRGRPRAARGARGNLSAQYEHTMIVTRAQPIVVAVH